MTVAPVAFESTIELEASAPEALTASAAPRSAGKARLRVALALAFTAGLLLGALAIYAWLWPVVRTTAAMPWTLDPAYQRTYVLLVADTFFRTSDIVQAEKDLGGWNRDDLNRLLAAMQAETIDYQTRLRLGTLANALKLPVSRPTSLLGSLLAQPGFLLALLVSVSPLLVALALVTFPRLRNTRLPGEVIPGAPGTARRRTAGGPYDPDLQDILDDLTPEQQAALEQAEQVEGQTQSAQAVEPNQTDSGGQTAEQGAKEGEEAKPEEKKEGEEGQEKSNETEEEEEEEDGALSDLASLFEEEDTSLSALEAFCKNMNEIKIDDLLQTGRDIAQSLRKANTYDSRHPGKPRPDSLM